MMQLVAFLVTFSISLPVSFGNEERPHPGTRDPERAQFWYHEATQALDQQNLELARTQFEKILAEYPRFEKKFSIYQKLMKIHLLQKSYSKVNQLGKDALLLHPDRTIAHAIQLMRIESQIRSGKPTLAKTIIDELLKQKPDETTQSSALIYKAESLSQIGKHQEALASLDAVRSHADLEDTTLKVKARKCGAMIRDSKDEWFFYFQSKNLCFKEVATLARYQPSKEAVEVWCDRFQGMESELNKTKVDEFTKKKLKTDFESTKALTVVWGCP